MVKSSLYAHSFKTTAAQHPMDEGNISLLPHSWSRTVMYRKCSSGGEAANDGMELVERLHGQHLGLDNQTSGESSRRTWSEGCRLLKREHRRRILRLPRRTGIYDSSSGEIPFDAELHAGDNCVRIAGVTTSKAAFDCLRVEQRRLRCDEN